MECPRMTLLLLALALVAGPFAGCLEGDTRDPAQGAAGDAFTRPDAPLLAAHWFAKCGLCAGVQGYAAPEWRAFAVYEDGTAALVYYNPARNEEALHVAPSVTFDRGALRSLFPEAGAWVARVDTGTLPGGAFADLAEAVNASWEAPNPSLRQPCMDCTGHGIFARYHEDETRDVIRPDGKPPEGAPESDAFRDVVAAFRQAEEAFEGATAAEPVTKTRLLLVENTFTVEGLEKASLRGNVHCRDARYDPDSRVLTVPVAPGTPPPQLVALRSLDPEAVGRELEAPEEGGQDLRDHFLVIETPGQVGVWSLLDFGRPLFNITLDGTQVRVDGKPLSDGEARELTFAYAFQESRGEPTPTYRVNETLVVRDAGEVALTMEEIGGLCTG